jgi:tricorn protease
VQIDLDGIGSRIAPVPLPAGILNSLAVRKDKFFYLATPQEARQAGTEDDDKPQNILHVYDVTKREDKTLLEGIDGYSLDKEGKKVIYKAAQVYGVVDTEPGKSKVGDGKLDLSGLQVQVDPREEWRQIFHEARRIERDFYWDPNMTGHDWKKIGDRYEALLPWVAHRIDLNYIIGEMIAELSTSHTYVGGGDQPQRPHIGVGMLGADFAAESGYYRIAKIYPGENWTEGARSPLTEPGLKVKAGDYIISVNGHEAHANQDVYAYFQNLAGKLVTLKINSKPATTMKTACVTWIGSKPIAARLRKPPAGVLATCTCRIRRSPESSPSTNSSLRNWTRTGLSSTSVATPAGKFRTSTPKN